MEGQTNRQIDRERETAEEVLVVLPETFQQIKESCSMGFCALCVSLVMYKL